MASAGDAWRLRRLESDAGRSRRSPNTRGRAAVCWFDAIAPDDRWAGCDAV